MMTEKLLLVKKIDEKNRQSYTNEKSTKCRKIGIEKEADENDRRKMRGVRKMEL